MNRIVSTIIISWFIYGSSAAAESSSYSCIINHVYSLSDNGVLNTSYWQKDFEGGEFTVLKNTGVIKGQTLTTIKANEIRGINPGSDKNTFKAIAYCKDQFQLIEIQEFKSGKNKPFIASSMGGAGIVTGTCE